MKNWSPLSLPYNTLEGYMIAPVTSEEDLVTMGRRLRNGLSMPTLAEKYAGMCEAGRRQIVLVTDPRGNPIANAQLRVLRSEEEHGQVEAMFVRGTGTDDLVEGNPAFDAVMHYVTDLNANRVETIAHVGADGFAQVGPQLALAPAPQVALTPWERAVQVAEANNMTPMQALIGGFATIEPVAEANALMVNPVVDEQNWTAMSNSYTVENGLVVEPISSRNGLKVLGEDLENMLFIESTVETYAHRCEANEIQIAAVRTAQGNIVGFTEMAGLNGQTVVLSCRGYADAAPSADVARAVMQYVSALTLNRVEGRNLFASGNGFSAEPFNFEDFAEVRIPPVLDVISRDGGYRGHYNAVEYQNEGRVNRLEVPVFNGQIPLYEADSDSLRRNGVPYGYSLRATDPVANVIEWTSIFGYHEAQNGLVLDVVSNNEELSVMGGMLNNALSSGGMRDDWAEKCTRGEMQIFRIVNTDADPERLVSNGILEVRDGRLAVKAHFSANNENPSVACNEALNEFVNLVNNDNLNLNANMVDNRFDVNPQYRMGH